MPIRASIAALRSASTPPGLVAVCTVALCEAVQQGLDLPSDTALVLWNIVRRSPEAPWSSTATAAIGASARASVVAIVVDAVLDRSNGLELAEAALDVLSEGTAAQHVKDRDLLAIAERVSGLRLVYRASNVVCAVCDARAVAPHVVALIADYWTRRGDKPSRISALDLLDHLPESTRRSLVEAALSAEYEAVRAVGALRVADAFDADAGLALVARCLATEPRARVVADLLAVKAEMLLRV